MTGPVAPPSRKPTEVVEGARSFGLGSVVLALLLATGVMAVLGSGALLDWASALPVGPISDFCVDLAGRWHDFMTEIGVARFAEGFRKLLQAFQAARW